MVCGGAQSLQNIMGFFTIPRLDVFFATAVNLQHFFLNLREAYCCYFKSSTTFGTPVDAFSAKTLILLVSEMEGLGSTK